MRDTLIADSDDIKFACSKCGQRMVVERSAAGLPADCPMCHCRITVPLPQSATEETNSSSAVAEHPSPEQPHHDSSLDHVHWKNLQEAQEEIARQHALFKKAVDECERLNANATHVQAESKRFQADRQQLKADAAHAKQLAVTAEARAAELAEALSVARQENVGLREQIENEMAALHERLTSTETQLEVREKELREARAENVQILEGLAQAQTEAAGVAAKAAGLRKELAVAQEEAQATAGHLATVEQQCRDTQTQLEAVREAHRQSSQQRDKWEEQAEGLRRDLSSSDSGRELLELRGKLQQLQEDHQRTETALAERTTDAKTAGATVESLRIELQELRSLHEDAERRAQAGSESQLMKDTDVLRGIVARQNTTLGVYHVELRRLRRGRFALRLVYAIFALGLLALGFFACKIFAPQDFARLSKPHELSKLFAH